MNLQLDNQKVAAWQLRFFWRPDLPGSVISHGTSRPRSRSQVTHGRKSTTATGALEELPACCCIFTRIEHSKKTASVIIGNYMIIQWLHSARCLAYIRRISNISVYQRGPCCFHLLWFSFLGFFRLKPHHESCHSMFSCCGLWLPSMKTSQFSTACSPNMWRSMMTCYTGHSSLINHRSIAIHDAQGATHLGWNTFWYTYNCRIYNMSLWHLIHLNCCWTQLAASSFMIIHVFMMSW